jgi:YbgC/YbaW family acyl-CoA thioester hydrolase
VRLQIQKNETPLGRLLRDGGVDFKSQPRVFLAVEPNNEMRGVFWMREPRTLYGTPDRALSGRLKSATSSRSCRSCNTTMITLAREPRRPIHHNARTEHKGFGIHQDFVTFVCFVVVDPCARRGEEQCVVSEYRLKRRVQFYETDAAGIVHFSWFPRYMEEAEHALWREAGLSIHAADTEIGWPRVAVSFEYHASLHFEDEFEVWIRIAAVTRRSIRLQLRESSRAPRRWAAAR